MVPNLNCLFCKNCIYTIKFVESLNNILESKVIVSHNISSVKCLAGTWELERILGKDKILYRTFIKTIVRNTEEIETLRQLTNITNDINICTKNIICKKFSLDKGEDIIVKFLFDK